MKYFHVLKSPLRAEKKWLISRLSETQSYFDNELHKNIPRIHRSAIAPLSLFYWCLSKRLRKTNLEKRALDLRDLALANVYKVDQPHILEAGPVAQYFGSLWAELGQPSPFFSLFRTEISKKTMSVAKRFLTNQRQTEYFYGAGGLLLLAHVQKNKQLFNFLINYLDKSAWQTEWGGGFKGHNSFLAGAFETRKIELAEQKKDRFVLGFAHGLAGTLAALCLGQELGHPKKKRIAKDLATTLMNIEAVNNSQPLPAVWPPVEFGLKIRTASAWCNGDPGIGWALGRYARVFKGDPRLQKSDAGRTAKNILLRSLDPSLKKMQQDGRFCHGHSSLAQMSLRAFLLTEDKRFLDFYLHWLRQLNTVTDPAGKWERWQSPAADELTFGELGIAFTMLTALGGVPVNWDGIYFLDL